MPSTFGGTAVKRKPLSGSRSSPVICSQIGMSGAEQARVHRPRADMHIVDIVAVDADQRRAMLGQPVAPRRRSETDGRRNRRRSANAGPSRCGPAPPCRATSRPSKSAASIARPCSIRPADDDPGQVRQRFEPQAGEILAVGVAVERAVEIGAGVGDHVDPADLEARAVVVVRRRCLARPRNRRCAARAGPCR